VRRIFELAGPLSRFCSGALRDGVGWAGSGDTLSFDGHYLLPVLRVSAVDLDGDDPAGFPAVQREPLSFSDNLCARLVAW
jgi:hypothetical protein